MAGLDKIIDQIHEESVLSANQIIAEARQTAAGIIEAARQESQQQCNLIREKSQTELKNYRERVKSSADFQRRTELLIAKQNIIAELIEKAYQTLNQQNADQYFDFIEKVIRKTALPKDGQIYFSQTDLARLPEGFEDIIKTAASTNHGTLTLMDEPKDIANGFILVYGGIEENCTFRALFEGKKEQLQDKAQAVLFS